MSTESPYRTPESNVAGGGSDDSDALERAFIGPKNTDYYLEKFAKYESGQGGLSWHWPAFFITWIWLGYRKMWLWFFAYWLGLPILVSMLSAGLAMVDPSLGLIANLGYVVGIFIVPPLIANKLYYQHARGKLSQARGASSDPQQQQLQAARLGGTSNIAIFIFILIFLIGILAAIAIPAYQDYTIRAQVSEGLNLSGGAKVAVTDYYLDTGYAPVDNDEAGLTAPESFSGNYTESIAVVDGDVVITYGNTAHQLLQGKTLVLEPSDDDGSVAWTCGSNAIEDKHLPAACRNVVYD